jgi:mannose-6-phosphate isomerase
MGPVKQPNDPSNASNLPELRTRLVQWLTEEAYATWAAHGIAADGGFIETLAQDGTPRADPRRARVHPRQVFAFALAPRFGWRGDAAPIVRRGIDYFIRHYRRPDGLFRTLIGVDGVPLDERALLYDQTFALLGYAAAATALDARTEFERRAIELRHEIERTLRCADGSFRSCDATDDVRESNPHMHLLEACLAWAEIGNDAAWAAWARDIVGLALSRFIEPKSGALGESFTPAWQPAPSLAGRIVEPGHQFEWAWLFLGCEARYPTSLRSRALRLVEIGETAGVHHGVAVNALLDDLSVQDANARFWPQTERLKAALFAARMTADARYVRMAHAAASSFFQYLRTAVPGLWLDIRRPDGQMVDSPAPASTFYHLVGAIAALDDFVNGSA